MTNELIFMFTSEQSDARAVCAECMCDVVADTTVKTEEDKKRPQKKEK